MQSPLMRIAWLVREKRRALRLSQRQVAARVGCSQSYVAQVETGVRPISQQLAERLEVLYGVGAGVYRRAEFVRGRPRLSVASRAVLKSIRRAQGLAPRQYLSRGKPFFGRADRVSGVENMVGSLAWRLRGRDERFWRKLNSVRFDSKAEVRFQVEIASSGAELVGAHWGKLGCSLPVVDGLTGRDAQNRVFPTFCLQDGEVAIAVSPQRCVRTPGGYRWTDNLLVMACGGKRITGAVEVDGAPFHTDEWAEAFRDAELGVPVLHLDPSEVGPGLVGRIFAWAREELAKV